MHAEALLIITLGALMHSCCKDRIEQEERSPGNDKVAVVTYRDCGVFGDGTSVALRDIHSADEDIVISADGHHAFIAIWKDEQTLKVFMPHTARSGSVVYPKVVRKNDDVKGTHIEYW